MLGEPPAEAVCIIIGHRQVERPGGHESEEGGGQHEARPGRLVSSQVSSLLQSILQLYRLHLPADFVSLCSLVIREMSYKNTVHGIVVIKSRVPVY